MRFIYLSYHYKTKEEQYSVQLILKATVLSGQTFGTLVELVVRFRNIWFCKLSGN